MKCYADAKRRDEHFDVGQWVYVKLRPGRQSSLAGHHHHPKLSKRFFGPFLVTERIGEVAYRLQLPPGVPLISPPRPLWPFSGIYRNLATAISRPTTSTPTLVFPGFEA